MNQQKQDVLYRLSIFYDPDPAVIFQRVVEAIVEVYGNTMAMVNVLEGERVRYRAVMNPHPLLKRLGSLHLRDTF